MAQEWESRTLSIITEKFRVWLLHDTTWMEGHGGDLHTDIGQMALAVFDLSGDNFITYEESAVPLDPASCADAHLLSPSPPAGSRRP